ncbi:MAG: GNAT family N-acetyltransferase [Bacteroidota bacterium]
MEIQHEDNGKKGAFYMELEGERLAEMTYTWAGESMFIIDHTEVSDKLKGQGAGKKLLEAVVLFARKMHLKILPLCPFAKSVFDKTPEYGDVLR